MESKFELQFEEGEYYLVRTDTNDVVATTDKVLLKEYPGYMQKLSLKNCEAIENGYDLDELAKLSYECDPYIAEYLEQEFKRGFQKALEILGNKKFSEKDIERAFIQGVYTKTEIHRKKEEYIQSLQQTEWDVEIVMDRDCYSSVGRCDKLTMADCIICTPVTYLKDADGCLILKRK